MPKVIFATNFLEQLEELDLQIKSLNRKKTIIILEALDALPDKEDLERLLDWDRIMVAVPDRQMLMQLNRLTGHIPNIKFIIDQTQPLFALSPGRPKVMT